MPQTEAQRRWYQENKERLKRKANERYHQNKEEINSKNKKRYEENKEFYNEQRRNKYQTDDEHRKKILTKGKEWVDKNKEKKAAMDKAYAQKNKDKINKRLKKRRETDINYKLASNLRNRLRQALKRISKTSSTMELLGCSIEELIKHLESKFEKGMTMANYGEWHIDHIKPCAAFDLTKEEEQKKCFHYTNLQPLWAKDNIKKSDKYDAPKAY